jgi:hypothetical protein
MLTLNVTNRIIMKITVWLIPTRQRFDNCLLKKFNYTCRKVSSMPKNDNLKIQVNLYEDFQKNRLHHFNEFHTLLGGTLHSVLSA